MEYVDIGGLRIAYHRPTGADPGASSPGRRPALVLLHGALGDSRDWRSQLATLTTQLDIVAWDAPGHGRSDDPPPGLTLEGFADLLAGFLDAVGLDRPAVLGLSLGSVHALTLYRRHPDRVGALVLAGPYAGWAGSLPPEEVAARKQMFLATLERPKRDWVPEFLATVFSPGTPADVIEEARRILDDVHIEGTRRMLETFADADLSDVLPLIDVPTLLVHGSLDVRSPRYVVDAMHAAIRGSTLAVLNGVGHGCNSEAPERFDATVLEFLHDRS